jgi:hypothetical protein
MVYGLLRALPGDHACLTPSPALLLADLTPALGRQNHTTWPSASAPFVTRCRSVHRIPPHVRNVRNAPLRDGTVRDIEVICPRRQEKFLKFRNQPECRRSGPDRSVDLVNQEDATDLPARASTTVDCFLCFLRKNFFHPLFSAAPIWHQRFQQLIKGWAMMRMN